MSLHTRGRARSRAFAPLAALLLAAAAATTACDGPLQTEPYDRVPAQQQIVDAATAQAALNGVYNALQSGGTDGSYYDLDIELLGDLAADNGTWVGTYQFLGDVEVNQIAADNPEVTSLWEGIYATIARANNVIQKVGALTNMDEDEKNNIVGQAYLIRALSYHNLVKLWGDVPMPLVPVTSADDAAKYTRAPAAQVYEQILSDIDQAKALMNDENDTRHANLVAADALRARVLFYRASLPGANAAADYQGALDAANAVFAVMGDTLTVPYADLFTATGQNTAEDIWRVTFTAAEFNNLGYYWLYDGRFEAAPTRDLGNSYEDGDERWAATVAYRPGSSTRFQGVKYPTTTGTEHPHIIRLAELVLIKAEVLARQNDLAGAVDEYNKVRVRAGLAPHVLGVDVTTQDDVMAAILEERRHELALEGDRWPDLVRLGVAGDYKDLAKPGYVLFPIPLRDISSSPLLTQNPDY